MVITELKNIVIKLIRMNTYVINFICDILYKINFKFNVSLLSITND